MHAAGCMDNIGRGRRARTLRKHVREWERAAVWIAKAFNTGWPTDIRQVLAYVRDRAEEPCSRGLPAAVLASLAFIEASGEVPETLRWSRHPALKNCVEELAVVLATNVRPSKQAERWPALLVIGLELVVTGHLARYARAFAWFLLVMLWTGMRWSDTKGLPSHKLLLTSWGLTGVLDRTKTTGAGKKVEQMMIYVSKDAWLRNETWLEEGFRL